MIIVAMLNFIYNSSSNELYALVDLMLATWKVSQIGSLTFNIADARGHTIMCMHNTDMLWNRIAKTHRANIGIASMAKRTCPPVKHCNRKRMWFKYKLGM